MSLICVLYKMLLIHVIWLYPLAEGCLPLLITVNNATKTVSMCKGSQLYFLLFCWIFFVTKYRPRSEDAVAYGSYCDLHPHQQHTGVPGQQVVVSSPPEENQTKERWDTLWLWFPNLSWCILIMEEPPVEKISHIFRSISTNNPFH